MKSLLIRCFVTLCVLNLFLSAHSQSTYYVSSNYGNDNNEGTFSNPFKTIQKAIDHLNAGDTCYLMQGIYRESAIIRDIKSSTEKRTVISSYPGQQATIKGLEIIDNSWTKYSDNIYKTTLTEDIWQLFINEKMVTSARWPNADAWTPDFWDRENNWGHQDGSSTYGNMIDDGTLNLAQENFNATGAVAILNVGSWLSFAEKVVAHTNNSNTFTYSTNFSENQFHHKVDHGYYFLEAHLELLDAPNEWYYNPESKELFLYTNDTINSTQSTIEGKTRTYGLEIIESENITIKNIDFFGCTFYGFSTRKLKIENCNIEFPSYSKRMLGELTKAAPTIINSKSLDGITGNVIRNCTFKYADGTGLHIAGKNDTVENCEFYQIDYSCVGSLHDVMINARHADQLCFKYNTLSVGGNSVGIKMGLKNIIAYNLVSQQGMLQNDGAAIQADASESNGAVMTHNWVHNTIKFGLRFDSPWNKPEVYGTNGTMSYNVIWNSKPMIPKGDEHHIYNNTSFNNNGFDLSIFSDETHGGYNHSTYIRNNLVGSISGSNANTITPYNGIIENCWIGVEESPEQEVASQLNDVQNHDFRPRKTSHIVDSGIFIEEYQHVFIGDSPDIGAYEYSDTIYWIPGQKINSASHPIPSNTGTAQSDIIDLIWRPAYKAKYHNVYLGTNYSAVQQANENSPEFIGEFYSNIADPGELKAGTTYYWRVDAFVENEIIHGKVWSFTPSKDANFTSIKSIEIIQNNLQFFPNPTTNNIKVLGPKGLAGTITIHNTYGQLLIKQEYSNPEGQLIAVGHLPAGIYILKINDFSNRFIKI